MDRRPVGVALVVLALTACMVLPALSGLRSTGTAVPIALPAPLAVGDCLAWVSSSAADTSQNPPLLSADEVLAGSCRGSVAGEVVAFWSTQEELATAPRSRRAGACSAPMAEYAGLYPAGTAARTSAAADDMVSWRPVLFYRAYLVTPTDLERRAGREWSACVIAPGGGLPYRGRLADSYRAGTVPVAFGSCWTPDPSGLLIGPADCAQPHSAQLLATGWTGERSLPPTADVAESCAGIAATLMDTDDPTHGGQLTLMADRMDRLNRGWTGNPASVGCFVAVAGDRRITGLVIGLGDRPVPFVS